MHVRGGKPAPIVLHFIIATLGPACTRAFGGRNPQVVVNMTVPSSKTPSKDTPAADLSRGSKDALSPSPERTGRQSNHRAKEIEDAVHDDADEPERKKQEPHDGVEDERKDGKRPADDEQYQPEQELQHVLQYDRAG